MSRKKHFNKGHSPNSSECAGCGRDIDISKKAHSMGDEHGTHHYDIEGEHLASELREPENRDFESGTHCPTCTDVATDPEGPAGQDYYRAKEEERAEATYERG